MAPHLSLDVTYLIHFLDWKLFFHILKSYILTHAFKTIFWKSEILQKCKTLAPVDFAFHEGKQWLVSLAAAELTVCMTHMFDMSTCALGCQAESRAVTGPDCEIDGPTGIGTGVNILLIEL